MTKYCPECNFPMRVYRDEYEALCDRCMIAVGMPRAAYNDMKKMAAETTETEDKFAAGFMDGVQDMARRAYRKAKA